MGLFGSLGQIAGGLIGKKLGNEKLGRELGGIGGDLVPAFKTGGKVSRTGKAIVHKGEYILPKSVKPTKAQRAKVSAIKAKAKRDKKGKK